MKGTTRFFGRLLAAALLVGLVFGIRYFGTRVGAGRRTAKVSYVFNSFEMGTLLTIKVRTSDQVEAERVAEIARDEVRRIQRVFDPGDPQSELSRLNDTRGQNRYTPVIDELALVLKTALRMRLLSEGLFDPALGELIRMWGFSHGRGRPAVPGSRALDSLLKATSWSGDISFSEDGRSVRMGPGAGSLDLGAIAKGYAVDRAVAALAGSGVTDALVNLGGEIGVLGTGPNGINWRVGVQHPRKRTYHLGAINLTQGLFVATSGDYENFFFYQGQRYHHILDPFTGFPAAHGVASATVIGGNCMEADALATIAVLMGPERAIKLMERIKVCAMVVYQPPGAGQDSLAFMSTDSFRSFLIPNLDGFSLE